MDLNELLRMVNVRRGKLAQPVTTDDL